MLVSGKVFQLMLESKYVSVPVNARLSQCVASLARVVSQFQCMLADANPCQSMTISANVCQPCHSMPNCDKYQAVSKSVSQSQDILTSAHLCQLMLINTKASQGMLIGTKA